MKRTLLVTVFAGAILLSMQVTQAQTAIYREVFGNNTAGNLAVNAVGWVGDYGATAQDSMTLSANNFGVSAQLNAPGGLPNINAPVELSQANGLLFTSGVAAGTTWIAYQNSYTVTQPILDISFYAGSTVGSDGVIPGFRIAVQQDGLWYASTEVLANSLNVSAAANFHLAPTAGGAQQETFTWTTAASAWDNLTFVPGTSLALGGISGGLNGDPITAFGLYSDGTDSLGNAVNTTRRISTFEIDTVPEPSSVVLVLSGVGLLMGLRRSRKA
ncbi:MAG: PEP-CTERM sorting domain-containing protein [Verrucomicrobiota bacterium]|jgi:hypothetical protein